jgi:preprotein translocase SecE subunit
VVARSSESKRQPRVRKTAPTVRELAEAAQAKSETKKPGRTRKLLSKPAAPIKKLKLSQKQPFKAVITFLRFIKKILAKLVPRYFINSWRELKLVHWPNRKETWRLTLAVFVFAIVFGALVAAVDKGLDEIFKKVVLK